jgi:hypothetical protein
VQYLYIFNSYDWVAVPIRIPFHNATYRKSCGVLVLFH